MSAVDYPEGGVLLWLDKGWGIIPGSYVLSYRSGREADPTTWVLQGPGHGTSATADMW